MLNGQTPYDALFNKAPDYSLMRVFGSLCYASVSPKSSDKFAPRAVKCVILGYLYGQKGNRLLDLETKRVFAYISI